MTAQFSLDPRIEEDSAFLADLKLCQVRLMDDARFPWLLLIPRRDGAVELIDLAPAERALLIEETAACAEALRAAAPCDKLNIGSLGNVVPQLHVHVIARTREDAAWPRPIWGFGEREPYAPEARGALTARLRSRILPKT